AAGAGGGLCQRYLRHGPAGRYAALGGSGFLDRRQLRLPRLRRGTAGHRIRPGRPLRDRGHGRGQRPVGRLHQRHRHVRAQLRRCQLERPELPYYRLRAPGRRRRGHAPIRLPGAVRQVGTDMNRNRKHPVRKQALAAVMAFGATLFALPVNSALGQSFPDFPLQTGAGNIEPNIMFILDDSGSMAFETMPNPDLSTVCRRSGSGCASGSTRFDITDETYTGNTIYYNPAVEYDPWITSSGSPMTDGTTMSAVYGSFNFPGSGHGGESDMVDLRDSDSCESYDRNGGSRTICGGVQVFHVPKDTSDTSTTYLRNSTNYYRYEIHHVNGTPHIVRSQQVNGGAPADQVGADTQVYTPTH